MESQAKVGSQVEAVVVVRTASAHVKVLDELSRTQGSSSQTRFFDISSHK